MLGYLCLSLWTGTASASRELAALEGCSSAVAGTRRLYALIVWVHAGGKDDDTAPELDMATAVEEEGDFPLPADMWGPLTASNCM
jgi:hypothetical protein